MKASKMTDDEALAILERNLFPDELDAAMEELARLRPAYEAFLATQSWDEEMKRATGQLPERESPEIEKQFNAAQARWLAAVRNSR